MAKPIGPTCNLECAYCYYLEKASLYPDRSDFRMSDDTLETFVRQYIEAQPGPAVSFAWQGGEPTLLGLDFFHRVVALQQKHAPDGVQVQNSLQTNGTLLDEEWCEFLAEHEFLVGISIDGPRALHDQFRRTRVDGATFDQVTNGLSLLQQHDVEHNVLCVVNALNSQHPLDVYRFFKMHGVEWIQFIPLVEPLDGSACTSENERIPDDRIPKRHDCNEVYSAPSWVSERGGLVEQHDDDYQRVLEAARATPVSHRSVDPEAYGTFMRTIFDEWVRNDVGTVSVRLFDQCLERLRYGTAGLCVFSETCGTQLAMEHNGDVYACDHFVEQGFERGNIHETHLARLVDDPGQRQFGDYKRDGLPNRCMSCDVRAFCNGGCPKNWHLETPDGELGLNYLCAGYRRFFTYVQPYLALFERTLDDGLPPAFVMDVVALLDDRHS